MIKNYFRTAFRNILRNKGYAFLNVFGLSIVIAACLLIFLVIQYETSYDDFHPGNERIYRITSILNSPEGITYSRGSSFPLARQLRIDYPQLEKVARINSVQGDQITVMDDQHRPSPKKFKEQGLFYVEPEFFEIFNFPLLEGDPKTALADPNTAIITQQTAEKYFGNWHAAMGKYILYNNKKVCRITGILKNLPSNTDFPLQVALSFKTSSHDSSIDWTSTHVDVNTFVVLPPNMSASGFNNELKRFAQKHKPAEFAKDNFQLQPLRDIHFDSRFGNYSGRVFSRELVTALSLIGIFLLLIGCINYINIATAQAVTRAREVGIRKVLGSRKHQLIWQFMSETFLLSTLAMLIALAAAYFTLPSLNRLLETSIQPQVNGKLLQFISMVVLIVTVLSGFYPAFVLAGFNPITALKSKLTGRQGSGIGLRRALVVLQFAVAQVLIIGTLIIVSQMSYFKNTYMGFDKEAIINVSIPFDDASRQQLNAFKNQLLQQSGIKNINFSAFTISDNKHWDSKFIFDNATQTTDFSADLKWADADIFKMYNLQFVAGRPYAASDTVNGFVVNETLVKKLGIQNPQDIIGKKINFWDGSIIAPIVGVVKDFHNTSLAKPLDPVVMASWKAVFENMSVKIQPQQAKQVLATIERTYNRLFPNYAFQYQFLDEKIAGFYKQENQLSQLYKIFAGIAIFISCLGLYGLISFMAVQRTKEIGVRKVLGATTGNIIYLFSIEFTMLIGIAFAIAAPIGWYFMNDWLNNFAFRININVRFFLWALVASVLIAWLAIGYRTIKAANTNPIKSLRE